jgi:hypothetical protein
MIRRMAPMWLFAVLFTITTLSCGEQREQYAIQEITFEAPSELDIREFTLDLDRGIFREGPSSFNQGIMMSTDNNFIVEWVYAPEYTPQLARLQALNGPAFFDGSSVTARTVGTPTVGTISGFSVTSVELALRWQGGQASGIIGVWQCQPSLRAINFIAFHNDPQGELNRFVSKFTCS